MASKKLFNESFLATYPLSNSVSEPVAMENGEIPNNNIIKITIILLSFIFYREIKYDVKQILSPHIKDKYIFTQVRYRP